MEQTYKIYKHRCINCGWDSWKPEKEELCECPCCHTTQTPFIVEHEMKRPEPYSCYDKSVYDACKFVATSLKAGAPIEAIDAYIKQLNLTTVKNALNALKRSSDGRSEG